MEKQKHTPGPFEMVVGRGCCFHEGNRVSIIKRTNDGGEEQDTTVAEVWPTSDDTDIADGHLFAAAPELLAFAKQYLRHLHEDMAGEQDEEHPAFETMREIAAAIAKAEQA
jgi:hypothetical protein